MGPIYLFDVASSQAQWLSLRQAAISSNVANANTPGYQAKDIESFSKLLDGKLIPIAVTSPMHIASGTASSPGETRDKDGWDIVHSGNSVSLEQEMLKAGDVNRDYSLNTAIVKSFQRMFMNSAKG
ncbi:MAG TPA: flagellar basal body rod protein FlgB [Rhodopseudomonas sp.]|uniref:flagellar basal body rod protein FlgB n=1 Tax=Rhodopseudomonas sp. TaxID=1078 RepID=UPI002EDA4F91